MLSLSQATYAGRLCQFNKYIFISVCGSTRMPVMPLSALGSWQYSYLDQGTKEEKTFFGNDLQSRRDVLMKYSQALVCTAQSHRQWQWQYPVPPPPTAARGGGRRCPGISYPPWMGCWDLLLGMVRERDGLASSSPASSASSDSSSSSSSSSSSYSIYFSFSFSSSSSSSSSSASSASSTSSTSSSTSSTSSASSSSSCSGESKVGVYLAAYIS